MLKRLDINGNPYIGVLCRASDCAALVSRDTDDRLVAELGEALGVPLARVSLGGSRVIGSLCALNSAGVAVSDITSDSELEIVKKSLPSGTRALRVASRLNAIGNNVLVNDRAALVHPDMGKATCRKLGDVLGVQVEKGTIAGMRTVGSAAAVTNKGVLCHPKATASERKLLAEIFKLPVTVGTANYASPMIGACIVANSKGACAGTPTTGIEMGRLEEALGFL